MITPQEIKEKAEKKYKNEFLEAFVADKNIFPLYIRGDKSYTKSSLADFEKEILSIVSKSKEKIKFGYTLVFQKIKTKYVGTQDLPTDIYFETEKDFLQFLGKEKEASNFKRNAQKIITLFPELKNWITENALKIIQNALEWDNLLKVCQYFKQNPQPNLYIRELPINVHTKFVENNKTILKSLLDVLISPFLNPEESNFEQRFHLKYSETQIRFKILDKEISQKFFSGIDDLAIPLSQFKNLKLPLKKILIVENKTTLYTTLTLPNMHETMAIFGSGYSVFNLKNIDWFNDLELFYWGDIDVQGFEILSQFRGYYPHTKSILMDKKTFDLFFENDLGTISKITTTLNLTPEEQDLYNILKENNARLEQEKIPFGYVNEVFGK